MKNPTQLTMLFGAILIAASACGTASYQPVVDPKGANMTNYPRDLEECRYLAEQVDVTGETAGSTVLGLVAGAAIGALTGGILGDAGVGAALGATTGGASGLLGGSAGAVKDRNAVVRKCLTGRGYQVLR